MFETIVTILIFFAAIVVAAVVLVGWLIIAIVRLLGRLIFGESQPARAFTGLLRAEAPLGRRCGNDRCCADNPGAADYCRRCGGLLRASVQHVPVRRVAVW